MKQSNSKIIGVGCEEGGKIPNSAFTDSSNYGNEETFLHLGRARLNNPHGGWAPNPTKKHEKKEWLQVDLGLTYNVVGVQTQGSKGFDEMTTAYEILVSNEPQMETKKQAISEELNSKRFKGNND